LCTKTYDKKIKPFIMSEQDPLLGRIFGEQFKLIRKLGQGGFGAVYEAYQASLDRQVAVKIMHASLSQDATMVTRFRREGLISTKLHHPAIVKVFSLGTTEDGLLWLAMEYLQGETIEQVLQRQKILSTAELLDLFTPIFEALEEAHQKTIFHRDLKTENIMVIEDERGRKLSKLLDFGIASLQNTDSVTKDGVISGTPAYMSPEQWDGLHKTDARSDVYAMGVILYRCLAGRFPFQADTTLAWMKHHNLDDPPDLSITSNGVQVLPEGLCQVIMQSLAKNPNERHQSMAAFLEALQRETPQHSTSPIAWAPPKIPAKLRFHSALTTETARDVLFKQNNDLLIVGDVGRILIFRAEQATWDMLECPVISRLRALWENERGVFIVGDEGILLLCEDGTNWNKIELPTRASLCAIWGTPGGMLFVAGENGTLLQSQDYGVTWTQRKTFSQETICALWGFQSDLLCLYAACTNGVILYSPDAGETWQTQESGVRATLLSIHGLSQTSLFIVGLGGVVLCSSDGHHWKSSQSNTSVTLHKIKEMKPGLVLAVGDHGTLLQRRDGGASWSPKQVTQQSLTALVSAPSGLYLVGQNNTVFASTDWTSFAILYCGSFPALYAVSLEAPYLVAGASGFFCRSQGGFSWAASVWPQAKSIHSIWRALDGTIYCAGEKGFIAASRDDCQSWSQNSGSFALNLYAVWGRDAENVYFVGESGTILHVTNYGQSTQARQTGTTSILTNIWGNKILYAIGVSGTILRSVDQGLSWSRCTSHTHEDLQSVWGYGEHDVFIVGNKGVILHSRDEGLTWNQRQSSTKENLYGIWGKDPHSIFIAGSNGILLHSQDQGWTWRRWPTGTISSLIHARQDDEGNVWVFGFDGTHLFYQNPLLFTEKPASEEADQTFNSNGATLPSR
jgi:serine/threonine protein kinase